MATLQSDVAIQNANLIISLAQQIKGIRAQVAEIVTVNTNNPLGNLWNALTTTALNGDGTLGTVDGSPNTAHKIDSRVYTALQRSVSATDLANGLQLVTDFNTFCAGTALSANAARPANIDALAM